MRLSDENTYPGYILQRRACIFTMMLRLPLIYIFTCLLVNPLFSQKDRHSISGFVKDAVTGESLIGASVAIIELKDGMVTDGSGYYSLSTTRSDSVTLRFSYVGYGIIEKRIFWGQDTRLDVELSPEGSQLEDVVIEASSLKDKLNSSQMSVDQLTMVEAKQLPALFGEVDIIKTLQLKPGVQSGGEGTSGIFVRGGGPDQNLVLLDEAQIYNPSHLLGFFSSFNSDAILDVKLFKGGFPSQYGGKLSSIIDVHQKEGNKRKFSGTGGLGLISSRLALEGPLKKDKASFIVAGRRTYVDLFTPVINDLKENDPNWNTIPDYFFYDLNAKINLDLGEKDRVYMSGYFGRDKFSFSSDDFSANFNWGNQSGTVHWNHIFNPRLFLRTFATYSQYDYSLRNQFSQFDFNLGSGIRDYNGQSELNWLPSNRHKIKFGAEYTHHKFSIARFEATSQDSTVNWQSGEEFFGSEYGFYLNEEFKVSPILTLNGGVRLSGFTSGGKSYLGLEPRASAKISVTDKVSLKGSYTRMYQYIHMVSNSGASLPTDIWYPSNEVVRPERADQVAAGVSFMLGDDFLITDEVYYKWLDNQIDYRDGAQIFFNPDLDGEFVFGDGWGYGNEIYFEKRMGKGNGFFDRMSGWIGYTLSWSWRQFEEINEGEAFHPRYDRRHDISIVWIQKISEKVSLTGTWVYGTGNAISLPVGRILVQGPAPNQNPSVIPIYIGRNTFRMPAYHRMDVGMVWKLKQRKWGTSDLTFSVYNAYNRRNAYFIYFDTIEDGNGNPSQFVPKQVSLFPILPSATWDFKF